MTAKGATQVTALPRPLPASPRNGSSSPRSSPKNGAATVGRPKASSRGGAVGELYLAQFLRAKGGRLRTPTSARSDATPRTVSASPRPPPSSRSVDG